MRVQCLTLMLALGAIASLAATSSAQVSKAMTPVSKIQSLSSDLSPEKSKATLQQAATSIREASTSILSCMTECGVTLAEAEGPYDDERKKFRSKVEEFLREIEKVEDEGRQLFEDVSSDQCSKVRFQVNHTLSIWEGLKKQIEETRRFLTQGLNTSGTLRNDLSKAGELVERQQQEAEKQEDDAIEKKTALFHQWLDLTGKSFEADAKQKDAYQRWYEFVSGGGDPYSEKGLELSTQWQESMVAVKETKIDAYEAFLELDKASKDLFEFYNVRARADETLRKFIADMSENDANRAFSDFDAWLKDFEKDVGG